MFMFKPEDIPPELPEEARIVLSALKPEPPALIARRKQLLAELTLQLSTTTGALRQLLIAVREVFLAMQPDVPFRASLAEDFSHALQRYTQESASRDAPPLLAECMSYLRERVESMGLGVMLERVRAAPGQAEDIPQK